MQILNYWKPIIISLVIFYGSVTSGQNLNKIPIFNIPHMDKIIHMLLYFILSVTLLASFIRKNKYKKIDQKIITFVWVVSYGLLMEVFQYYFTQTRSAEIYDSLANTAGCIFAVLFYPYINKYQLQKIL